MRYGLLGMHPGRGRMGQRCLRMLQLAIYLLKLGKLHTINGLALRNRLR